MSQQINGKGLAFAPAGAKAVCIGHRGKTMKKIHFLDTTLRDGEQAPGYSMNLTEKLEIAKQLERLGVDVIEAGFAITSPGDFEAVDRVAREIKNCGVCSLARAVQKDIDAAYEALKHAVKPRIHVFIATSPVHMEHKLRMSPDEVFEQAAAMVAYTSSLCPEVEFTAEDAFRTELPFLVRMLEGAVRAGATILNLPDTVGYSEPKEVEERIGYLLQNVKGIEKCELSIHCHDDLGVGVANSLAALRAGATQVEATVNGIGERAGNAALEEIAMAIATRPDIYRAEMNINTREIYHTSHLVQSVTGLQIPVNKAIVGANAFTHEAGIHQHGVMAERSTYEIMRPEMIGIPVSSGMVLGKHSGRHAFVQRLEELGYRLEGAELDKVFERFKKLADKKRKVLDRDIEALVGSGKEESIGRYGLENFHISIASGAPSSASISLSADGDTYARTAQGTGPIDAAFTAVNSIIGRELELVNYSLNSVTEGEDALGEAVVKLSHNGKSAVGRGVSTDVIEASIRAYVAGVNRLLENE